MTLVITCVNREIGIWQSSDHALTVGGKRIDDNWCKQVAIICASGRAILGYSGLARSPGNRTIAEHISFAAAIDGEARRYRGGYATRNNPITPLQTIWRIRDHLTERFRLWGQWSKSYVGLKLIVSGAIIENDDIEFVAIFNYDDDGIVYPEFQVGRIRLGDQRSMVIAHGSGERHFLNAGHSLRVASIVERRPRDNANYLSLLTSVNRRVARERNQQDVTPWSQAAFMPKTDWPVLGKMYHPPDIDIPRTFRPVRLVLMGTDVSAIARTAPLKSGRDTTVSWSLRWDPK